MKRIFIILALFSSPSFADEYNAGYEHGCSIGVDAPDSASNEYKYGAREGVDDATDDEQIEHQQSQN